MSFSFLTSLDHKFHYYCSNVHDKWESSNNHGKITESSHQAIGMVESETDLAAKSVMTFWFVVSYLVLFFEMS
jgi:hypothetical protein